MVATRQAWASTVNTAAAAALTPYEWFTPDLKCDMHLDALVTMLTLHYGEDKHNKLLPLHYVQQNQ